MVIHLVKFGIILLSHDRLDDFANQSRCLSAPDIGILPDLNLRTSTLMCTYVTGILTDYKALACCYGLPYRPFELTLQLILYDVQICSTSGIGFPGPELRQGSGLSLRTMRWRNRWTTLEYVTHTFFK